MTPRALAALIALCALALAAPCRADASCAATIAELRGLLGDATLPLEWRETTMDDGKPLTLSILEKEGALFLAFVKTGEGLWIEGASVVCRNCSDLEARFVADRARVGDLRGHTSSRRIGVDREGEGPQLTA